MINVELDPRLPLPPVKGVEHKEEPYKTVPDYEIGDVLEVSLGDLEPGIPGDASSNGLLPPDGVVILSQTTRMTDTGQMVVDVLLDVMDVYGASDYEVRMATA